MKRKILLAVDDSVHSKNTIRYSTRISSYVEGVSYTLFNVQPAISQFLADEAKTNLRAKSLLGKAKKKSAEKARNMLETYKGRMIEMGVDEKRISIESRPKKAGLAKDILEYAQENLYDAIVVGRRGLSRVQEVFMGSLTTNLLEHSQLIPVWVVDGEVKSEKIMIATDGSESALRAVDHFAFMTAHNPNIRVTLLHVVPTLKDFCKIDFAEKDEELEEIMINGHKKCVENFLVHAYKKFRESGIQESQIDIKEVKAIVNVGGVIVSEAENGNYGTVVVGRRGASKAFFMGSVSKYVLEKLSDRALWLVP